MDEKTYDRTTDDMGNIIGMEHVNVLVPDQKMATDFYAGGLGLTRDPYMMADTDNMWINIGDQQFHLPTRGTQVLRGHVGLVVPDLEGVKARLTHLRESGKLDGTSFTCSADNGYVSATCPWGNKYRIYQAGAFGKMNLGIPYVEFDVEPGAAAGIGQFYMKVLKAPYTLTQDINGGVAHVKVGRNQELIFRETTEPLPNYDGHHIAIYVVNFSGPHKFLCEHGLITQETDQHQYRFEDIVHPETGKVLFKIEHEVRSFYHPMFGREIVNRNPSQSLRAYTRGSDVLVVA